MPDAPTAIAKRLFADNVVWDDHAGFGPSPKVDLKKLQIWKDAGVNYLSIDAGYDVIRVDLQHGQDIRALEYPGDVLGILAAPPCTVFCRPGARLWKEWPAERLLDGLASAPAGGEQKLTAIPQGDGDGIARAGLTPVGHGDLQGEVAGQRDRGRWVRDMSSTLDESSALSILRV